MNTNETQPNNADDVLTTVEAAALLKISTKTLRRMVLAGRLSPRRFGTRGQVWRFVRSELLAPPLTDVSASVPAPPVGAPTKPGTGRRLSRIDGVLRYR